MKTHTPQKIFVLGASDNQTRYSYKAYSMLKKHGYKVIPISPNIKLLDGEKVWPNLQAAYDDNGLPDTLTMYVSSVISSKLTDEILRFKPKRVIFNPGSENEHLSQTLSENGVNVVEACTLVMLQTGQF